MTAEKQPAETDLGQVAYDAWCAAAHLVTFACSEIQPLEQTWWQAAAAAVKLEVLLQEPEPAEPRIWICEVAEGPGAPLYRYLACGVGDPAEHWTQVDLQQGLTLRFRYSDADAAPVQTPACIHAWVFVDRHGSDGSVWGCTRCDQLQIRRLPGGLMW